MPGLKIRLFYKEKFMLCGIIGAMPKEVEAIKDKMLNIKEENIQGVDFYFGKINNQDVILTKSGVGKVNASIITTLMIMTYHPDYIVNIGTAGGMLKEQNTLDIVISENVIQHDFDTSYIDGKSGIGITTKSDELLRNKVKESFLKNKVDSNIYFGDIISGDVFVGEEVKVLELKEKFPTAIACEMEAAAIGYTCDKFNIPFIIIRSLSDIVHHDNSNIDFMKNVEITSKRSADMLEEFLK
ncbi:5'-methylthioadenosine/adenosylhomocysteine nucleosidase [Helcococcus ovis]|uniref:adenosylhomocysteine nucleosidase n=2 Tax=Peptoniphilaceae TaxID=1570339 RepID=A0A4R9C3U4_9FIRM|nr:5'-methylthioadenosine/adenosylhomocysteine nucleosidase [Helcococcus ovis]TFF67683.1 5'-methylthioadenosine/adenosylhomocysteine nucleosidase [Helcococcus ovis]TFF68746.1 5'-methylthioadenosine/adenosylhomocysteine nucleosidase [Helcococcus ovis]